MPMRCAVGCCDASFYKSKKTGEHLSFFQFPNSKMLRREWIRRCRRKCAFSVNSARICSRHFKSADFEDEIKAKIMNQAPKILKKTALPTLHLKSEADDNLEEITASHRAQRMTVRENKKIVEEIMKGEEKKEIIRNSDKVEADTSEDVEEVLQVTSSSKHALRGDESLEHSYCMEPNCELEDREELAALPVQSTSPNRKRMREDSFTEDGNSREISDSSETPVDNTSVMASFFDYLLAECSQIEDPDVLNNLKTNLFYVVMESVKLDISKRTPSSPSF